MVELLWERLWTHRPIGLCHKAMWNRLISLFVQEAKTPVRQTGNERAGHGGVAGGRIAVGKIMDAQTNRSVPRKVVPSLAVLVRPQRPAVRMPAPEPLLACNNQGMRIRVCSQLPSAPRRWLPIIREQLAAQRDLPERVPDSGRLSRSAASMLR